MDRKQRVIIRWNVLYILTLGYVVVSIFFLFILWRCTDATTAYNAIEAPLMALLGGSLAISKDLIENKNSETNSKDSDNSST